MTDDEINEHFEFIDGIQKAQMLVLRLLLREQPNLKVKLQQYAEHLDANPAADDLTAIQMQSMRDQLLQLSR